MQNSAGPAFLADCPTRLAVQILADKWSTLVIYALSRSPRRHGELVDVVVVDHHKCAAALPLAHALVNPNRLDETDGAAHGHLAAVGVAFLLAAALTRTLRARGFFAGRPEPRLLDLLDIVALGTVADVAQLKGLNRAFVAQGLKVMAARRNIGLNALIEASRLSRAPAASDLGFALGPRINAGGRVGKADLGVRLLTTNDPDEARTIASELDRLNEERRAIEGQVQEAAEALVAQPWRRHGHRRDEAGKNDEILFVHETQLRGGQLVAAQPHAQRIEHDVTLVIGVAHLVEGPGAQQVEVQGRFSQDMMSRAVGPR